ncbi:hypothetical protein F5890DRAFT_1376119, partial [Lentinula detonsa]
FQNNTREELAFIFLQFWLLLISILAMVYDSSQRTIFQSLIQSPGSPCSIALFDSYFATRVWYETYNAQVFTCVGAPKAITDLYKVFF